ncbi:MAG: hypothetical protein ACK5MN_10440 [Lachnospiraceae bacterium]
MKKFICYLCAVVLAALSLNVPVAADGLAYADGTYTGTQAVVPTGSYQGYNVQSTVTITGGVISNVQFDYAVPQESYIYKVLFDAANVNTKMVQTNSTNVDIVSGATDLSNAAIGATNVALAQAEIKPEQGVLLEVQGAKYYSFDLRGREDLPAFSGLAGETAVTVEDLSQIGTTGIYVYCNAPLTGELFGVTSMTFSDYFYGENNGLSSTASVAENYGSTSSASALDAVGYYDVVTSATNSNSHWSDVPSILDVESGSPGNSITAINTVEVKAAASLYINAKILASYGVDSKLASLADKIVLNADPTAPTYRNNIKTLLADGTYSEAEEMAGNTLLPVPASSSSYSYTNNYADTMFQVNFDSTQYAQYSDYMHKLYAVIITNEQGVSRGAVHWEDVWTEASRNGFIQVGISDGDIVPAGSNYFASYRFDSFFNEDRDSLKPGVYTYTVKAYGYADQTGSFTVGQALASNQKITAANATWTTDGASVAITSTLPAEYGLAIDAQITVKKGSGRNAVTLTEEEYTYNRATNLLTINNSANTGVGAYTIEVTKDGYQSASASFTLNSALEAEKLSITQNADGAWEFAIAENSENFTAEQYLAQISSISVNGSSLRGNNLGSTVFTVKDGAVLVNFAAEISSRGQTTPVFADGQAGQYTITLAANGYPSLTATVGDNVIEAVNQVTALITALPEEAQLALGDETALKAAQSAYDALSALEKSYVSESAKTKLAALQTKMTALKAAVKNGWKTESGKVYYYKNNVKLTGFQTISGKKYYFSKASATKGQMLTGFQTISGKKYYFSKASKTQGQMLTGFQTISSKKYYFAKSSATQGQMLTGFQTISGKKYYFSKASKTQGQMLTGLQTISGKKYYFSKASATQGQMLTKRWVKVGTKSYYLSTSGVVTKTK